MKKGLKYTLVSLGSLVVLAGVGLGIMYVLSPYKVKSVLGDRIRIIKVDVDKYGVTASQYRIQSVPTLMLFRNGEVLWRTSGVVDKAELLATLDPFLT